MRYLAATLTVVALLSLIVTGCATEPSYLAAPPDLPKTDAPNNYMQIVVYYPDKDALAKEVHEVPKEADRVKAALDILFESKPNNGNIMAVMPENVKVLGTKIDNNMITINFNRNILNFSGNKSSQDLLLMAIISTAKQSNSLKQFKFQVEGKEKGQIDGKDVEKFWGGVTLKDQPWKT
ncbi:MAG: GerMN domain-containing protein [Candidatus Aquicultor sp.]